MCRTLRSEEVITDLERSYTKRCSGCDSRLCLHVLRVRVSIAEVLAQNVENSFEYIVY